MMATERYNGRVVRDHRTCVCGCDRRFPVTSANGRQRCFSRGCADTMRRRGTAAWRVKTTRAFRKSRFGPAVKAAVEAGRIQEGDLLALLADAYRQGYEAGWKCVAKRQAAA